MVLITVFKNRSGDGGWDGDEGWDFRKEQRKTTLLRTTGNDGGRVCLGAVDGRRTRVGGGRPAMAARP